MRILVGAVTVATALCGSASATQTIPIAPLSGLIAHNKAGGAGQETVRYDFAAPGETYPVDDAEDMCGSSIPDSEIPDSEETRAPKPVSASHRLESANVQGSQPTGYGTSGQELRTGDLSGPTITAAAQKGEKPGFHWENAVRQSLLFLAISTAFRFATEPSTRAEMKGPYWSDYFHSVGHLRGWGDGDEFLVNYIGHPLEGAVTGYIQVQNDPKGIKQEVGFNKGYWASRLKAFGWAAAYSTQYEIGLVSEASLGNVGLKPGDKSNHPMAYVDLVVTPVLGTAWLVGEDLIDRYVLERFEDKVKNRWVRAIVRSIMNPSRSFANMHRGEWFWHRDSRPLRAF